MNVHVIMSGSRLVDVFSFRDSKILSSTESRQRNNLIIYKNLGIIFGSNHHRSFHLISYSTISFNNGKCISQSFHRYRLIHNNIRTIITSTCRKVSIIISISNRNRFASNNFCSNKCIKIICRILTFNYV